MEASTSTHGGSRKKWTREICIAAIQEVAATLGKTPTIQEMHAHGYTFATSCQTLGLGSYGSLVVEAGLTPNGRGGHTRSGRSPLAGSPPVTQAAPAAEPAGRPEHHPLTATIHAEADRLVAQAGSLLDRASTLREHAVAIEELAA
jgi:hypothetical protein